LPIQSQHESSASFEADIRVRQDFRKQRRANTRNALADERRASKIASPLSILPVVWMPRMSADQPIQK
jgi:hypothetical protein